MRFSKLTVLQQTPEAFQIVSVNIAVHVFNGVVDYLVAIVGVQSFAGQQLVAVNRGASFYVLTDML